MKCRMIMTTGMLIFPLQLVLRDNDIVEVPADIYKCQRLRTFHLQVNQINVLPPEISKLTFSTFMKKSYSLIVLLCEMCGSRVIMSPCIKESPEMSPSLQYI